MYCCVNSKRDYIALFINFHIYFMFHIQNTNIRPGCNRTNLTFIIKRSEGNFLFLSKLQRPKWLPSLITSILICLWFLPLLFKSPSILRIHHLDLLFFLVPIISCRSIWFGYLSRGILQMFQPFNSSLLYKAFNVFHHLI